MARASQRPRKVKPEAAAAMADENGGAGPSQHEEDGAAAARPSREGGAWAAWMAASNVPHGLMRHVRHAFLQVMFNNGMLQQETHSTGDGEPVAGAREIYQELSGAPDGSTFADFLADCNEQLAFLEMEIKSLRFPGDGKTYVALVNLHADDHAKALTHKYSLGELAYFRALVETIAEADTGDVDGVPVIASSAALNMEVDAPSATQAAAATIDPSQASQVPQTQVGRGKPLSKEQKQKALGNLTRDGWMARHPTKAGHGIIGPRTFMALGGWLMSLDLPDRTRAAWDRLL